MKSNNLFSDLPDQLTQEVFETLINHKNIKIERIVSPRNSRTPENEWFNQDLDEFVMLLKGSAVLLFKESTESVNLEPGDYINIPRHTAHRVESTDKKLETIWLAIHYQ